MFYEFSSVKCGTSGILPVSRREQNEVDDFSKSTSQLKSTNRDSSKIFPLLFSLMIVLFKLIFVLVYEIRECFHGF